MEVSEEVKPLSLPSNFYCHTWFILPYVCTLSLEPVHSHVKSVKR